MERTDVESKRNTMPSLKDEANQSGVVEGTFSPVQFSEENTEILNVKSKAENEQQIQELLRSINEETLRLSEYLMEENRLIKDLCIPLKQILKRLHITLNIPPQDLPVKKKAKKAILDEEANLTFVYGKGEVQSAFLAEYPSEIVMAVLWLTMPELANAIRLYRKRLKVRVNFFGKVKKELKNALKAMVGSKES